MGEIPEFLTTSDWANLSGLLIPFWGLLFSVIAFASSLLLAQAVIPSLATTRDLPDPRLVKLRPPQYLGAAAFFGLAIFMVVVIFTRVGILDKFFDFRLI